MHFILARRVQGKICQSKKIYYIIYFFDVYKASVRVKVSLFRSKCLDKTTILKMEKIEQAEEEQEST
jgi:hypothetical protein